MLGAVSCVAAAFGGGQNSNPDVFGGQGDADSDDFSEMIRCMEGSRVVAGTTAGDLRVWSGTLETRCY